MSGIRGSNTKPELVIRSVLHRLGFRFRLHVRDLPGKPDIVLPRHRAVVFVHGCFWHGHTCPLFKVPGTRQEFWKDKIRRNQINDKRAVEALLEANWRVAIVWECAIRGSGKDITNVGQRLAEWLGSEEQTAEVM